MPRKHVCRWTIVFVVILPIALLVPSIVSSEEIRWISDSDGRWGDASNWDLGRVPEELDEVWIQHEDNPVVSIDTISSALSLRAETPLVMHDDARLTLTGTSIVTSALEINDFQLIATGAEASFRADGPVDLQSAFIRAESGADIVISQLQAYDGRCDSRLGNYWEATGEGSLIQFPSLESIAVVRDTSASCRQRLSAHFGGFASFPALRSLDGEVLVFTTEPESVINLAALQRSHGTTYEIGGGARVDVPKLGEIVDSRITVTGSEFSAPSLVTAEHVFLSAEAATISFPQLQRYGTAAKGRTPVWFAEGDGARIDLARLESLEPQTRLDLRAEDRGEVNFPLLASVGPSGSFHATATGGGRIDLANLTDIDDSTQFRIEVRDADSVVDISALEVLSGSISVGSGATLRWSNPTDLNGVALTVMGDANISTEQLRSITNGSITSDRPLPNVENINGSSIAGAAVLPAVTKFEADGGATWNIGDLAHLPNLMSISTEASTGRLFAGIRGGTLSVPSLTALRGTADNYVVFDIYSGADWTASRLVAPSLVDVAHSVVRVRSGTALMSAPTATRLTQSSVVVDVGALVANIDLSHGSELIGRGIGHIDGNVFNSYGLISPGQQSIRPQYMGFDNYEPQGDVASMTIHGNLTQTDGATLIHVQGNSQSERHDQVIVTRTAFLGGELSLEVTADYAPQIGDMAEVIVAGNIEGTFQRVESKGFVDPELTFAVLYGEQAVRSRVSLWGDANFDNRFDSQDLVSVFQQGEYEDHIMGNSSWVTGDWNGDAEFSSSDLIAAFAYGHYDQGLRTDIVKSVPEPTCAGALGMLAFLVFQIRARHAGARSRAR